MNKIFEKAKDKNVAAVVLYVSDGALYYDEAHEEPVAYAEDAIELFLNKAVIFDNDMCIRPLSITEAGAMSYGESTTSALPERPEPELPEDAHTIPPNKWNGDKEEENPDTDDEDPIL